MDGSQLFEVWAPQESIWSRWAKPAPFAGGAPVLAAQPLPEMPVYEADPGPEQFDQPALDPLTAFLVDLPGERSVDVGLALARAGYRPVPLFNTAYHPFAIVPVEPILKRLRDGASELLSLTIPANAPPAFLLDAKRLDPSVPAEPGKFDNRWVVFPQDFPSATFLLAQGIRRVVVLQEETLQGKPRLDLAHVLERWRQAGVELYVQDPESGMSPRPMQVDRPSAFRSLFYRALTLAGLRRSSAGGFGSVIPIPSQGRSGFG